MNLTAISVKFSLFSYIIMVINPVIISTGFSVLSSSTCCFLVRFPRAVYSEAFAQRYLNVFVPLLSTNLLTIFDVSCVLSISS